MTLRVLPLVTQVFHLVAPTGGIMSEPRLTTKHLAAPRKLILLVNRRKEGGFQAVTLSGEVALIGDSHDEIKEKMRAQVKAMDSHVRPTTVRLHFIDDQRHWILSTLPDGNTQQQKPAASKNSSQHKSGNGENTSQPTKKKK